MTTISDPHLGRRGHAILDADTVELLPPLYSTDGQPLDDKRLPVKLFSPYIEWRWWLAELDPDTLQAFGFVTSPLCPDGEWGYIDVAELRDLTVGPDLPAVERDLYWDQDATFRVVAEEVRR